MSSPRPQRADAVRNRAKIMAAAHEQITANGPEVSMEQIATAAGFAVGTLYKHFPTKTDLVAAVVAASITAVADDAEAALSRTCDDGSPALEEITGFLTRLIDTAAHDHAVKAAARALAADPAALHDEARATAALDRLIHAAHQHGDLRPDFSVDDLYLLFSTAPTDQPAHVRARWLALLITGLTAR
ncbi:TetR/AcrR family transcriptional regulator [Microbispora corallina]|uniref:TetR family transcriptional regulator n=1 Tax=Microbispora corallina TaxID=83302 RepID=A0ABQ4FUT8_9ACTN|nr:TetR/AcrR family transcriptional regulator [Microbispora corallina]GIH38580.1 TetR family transcriptional regulator [Microbispora corallina]